jgi:transcriptional regulator with XRE-family HTH domain
MDDALYFRRQGFWLRMARERAGKSQKGAAVEIGLAETSKSTISDYENGSQIAPQQVLRQLARWYGVPVELFTHPRLTADEVIDAMIDDVARLGTEAEQRDWRAGQDRGREAGDEPDDGPDRLPA